MLQFYLLLAYTPDYIKLDCLLAGGEVPQIEYSSGNKNKECFFTFPSSSSIMYYKGSWFIGRCMLKYSILYFSFEHTL